MNVIDKLQECVQSYENEEYGLIEIRLLKDAIKELSKKTREKRGPKRYNLATFIYSNGYNPRVLAIEMGLNQSVIYNWINGYRKPSNSAKYFFAQKFNMTYEDVEKLFEVTNGRKETDC